MDNKKNKIETEIEFQDLIKNPIRLFGWIYPLIVVLLIVGGVFFVKNLNHIYRNEISPLLNDSSLVKTDLDIVAKKGGIVPAVDLNLISNPTSEFIAKGKELYLANCQSCHGEQGKGDGPSGLMLNPKPRNFHSADGWTNGRTFADLYKTLQEGILKNGMAAYEYIPSGDRIAIISYLRTFSDYPTITSTEVKDVDTKYNLSAGTQIPNQIPIKKGIELLSIEYENSFTEEQINLKNSDLTSYDDIKKSILNINKTDVLLMIPDTLWSQEKMISIILNNPNGFGFKSNVNSLSKDSWVNLYSVINKYRFSKK